MEISELLTWTGNLIILVLAPILVLNLFVLLFARQIKDRVAEELDGIAQDLEQENLIALTVEVDGDQFLCYNTTTMTFVCQGRDLDEIRKRFRQRFPNKNAAIYNGDESAVAVLKKQLKELNENSRGIGSAS